MFYPRRWNDALWRWYCWTFCNREKKPLQSYTQVCLMCVWCVWIFWMLLYVKARDKDKPGLLSLSSLSSTSPETPRSLDWSCTLILSLLLIRHTELLRDRWISQKSSWRTQLEKRTIVLTCVSYLQHWHLRSVNFVVQSSTKINRHKINPKFTLQSLWVLNK